MARVQGLEQTTTGQATAIDLLEVTAGNQGSRIVGLEQASAGQAQRVGTLETTVEGHGSAIGNLEQTTAQQATRVNNLETTSGQHASSISGLEQTTAGQAQRVTALETTTGDHTASIEQLQATDSTHAQQIGQLQVSAGGASAAITDLQDVTASTAQRVTTVEAEQGDHAAAIQTLERVDAERALLMMQMLASDGEDDGAISEQREVSTTQARRIAQVGVRAEDAHVRIGQEEAARIDADGAQALLIQALAASLQQTDAGVAANAGAISQLSGQVSVIDGAVQAQAIELTSLRSDLATAQGNIGAAADAVQLLRTDVNNIDDRVSSQAQAITQISATATNAGSAAADAQAAADAAAQAAANAAGIANGKGKVIIQSAQPAAADRLAQNLWIDTTVGANTPKRWSGSAWVAVTDKAATDAANAAAAAQQTANDATNAASAAHAAANTAQGAANQAAADAAAAAGIANGKGKVLIQSAAPAVADRLPQNLWIDTTGGANTPKRWSGSAWVAVTDKAATDAAAAAVAAKAAADAAQVAADAADAKAIAAQADVQQEATARAAADSAMATRVDGVDARIGTAEGGIAANAYAISGLTARADDHDGELLAQAQSILGLQASVTNAEGEIAAVQQDIDVLATESGHYAAQYVLRVEAGGVVGGMAITGSDSQSAGPRLDFRIRADVFSVAGTGSVPGITPFAVQTASQTVHGVVVPAGVYMDAAYIRNVQALWARFGTLIAQSIQTTELSASQLTLGNGTVGGDLRSLNFATGSAGWRIQRGGVAEFNNITVRGAVHANSGAIGGLQIAATYIQSPNFNFAQGTGYRMWNNGTVQGGTFQGARFEGSDYVYVKNGGSFGIHDAASNTWKVLYDGPTGVWNMNLVFNQYGSSYMAGLRTTTHEMENLPTGVGGNRIVATGRRFNCYIEGIGNTQIVIGDQVT
ncbi:hypothetical protein GCM10025795_02280 [Verticiella sediminum]